MAKRKSKKHHKKHHTKKSKLSKNQKMFLGTIVVLAFFLFPIPYEATEVYSTEMPYQVEETYLEQVPDNCGEAFPDTKWNGKVELSVDQRTIICKFSVTNQDNFFIEYLADVISISKDGSIRDKQVAIFKLAPQETKSKTVQLAYGGILACQPANIRVTPMKEVCTGLKTIQATRVVRKVKTVDQQRIVKRSTSAYEMLTGKTQWYYRVG